MDPRVGGQMEGILSTCKSALAREVQFPRERTFKFRRSSWVRHQFSWETELSKMSFRSSKVLKSWSDQITGAWDTVAFGRSAGTGNGGLGISASADSSDSCSSRKSSTFTAGRVQIFSVKFLTKICCRLMGGFCEGVPARNFLWIFCGKNWSLSYFPKSFPVMWLRIPGKKSSEGCVSLLRSGTLAALRFGSRKVCA